MITGRGKAFCAGADLVLFREWKGEAPSLIWHLAGALNRVIERIRRIPVPVLAVVNGPAVGAGFSIALACDMAIASERAFFNMAYMRIAFCPDGGGSLFLSRILGLKRAMEIFLLTEDISAQQALSLGLINYLFSEEELEERTKEIVERLKGLPSKAVRFTKGLVNEALFGGLEGHLERERTLITELAGEEDFTKGLERFFSQRG